MKDKESKPTTKPFTYKEQHAVIVKTANEKEQKQVFEQLRALGFTDLKLVSV